MIEPVFVGDMKKSYFAIENQKSTYDQKMLLQNQIEGIISVENRILDNKEQYYYDITRKQSLLHYYEEKKASGTEVQNIILSIIFTIENSKKYLLKEDSFIIRPDFIYQDGIQNKIELCYLGGENKKIREQIGNLMEFFMNKIDYQDEKAVLLTYGIYKVTQTEYCTFSDIQNVISQYSQQDKREIVVKKEQTPQFIENNKNINNMSSFSKNIFLTVLLSLVFIIELFTAFKIHFFIKPVSQTIDCMKILLFLIFMASTEVIVYIKGKTIVNKKSQISKRKDIAEESTIVLANFQQENMESNREEKRIVLIPLNNVLEQEIEIKMLPCIIGKSAKDATYIISRNTVSNSHLRIYIENKKLFLEDLNSTNGTYLNNIKLEAGKEYELNIGDTIGIAQYTYTLEEKYTI
ncbi:DUF6382 domain-containing protein [Anaeromicropila populeti]|uniref:FHA domain-containing protein n=1 Tax=Anaeromicropila populeti TaxID=37658 RepID=A0A1I6LS68_9FIRM|nr:DUF6382 domain-containing protein [Anaeromicropila populeti]SFS06293.1 FHA domain-containing protein [Anaeromicropila populeti]